MSPVKCWDHVDNTILRIIVFPIDMQYFLIKQICLCQVLLPLVQIFSQLSPPIDLGHRSEDILVAMQLMMMFGSQMTTSY